MSRAGLPTRSGPAGSVSLNVATITLVAAMFWVAVTLTAVPVTGTNTGAAVTVALGCTTAVGAAPWLIDTVMLNTPSVVHVWVPRTVKVCVVASYVMTPVPGPVLS